jgi:hypothetical protein
MWGIDWFYLDKDRWRELVNVVMKLKISITFGQFLVYLRTCYRLGKVLLHVVSYFVACQAIK